MYVVCIMLIEKKEGKFISAAFFVGFYTTKRTLLIRIPDYTKYSDSFPGSVVVRTNDLALSSYLVKKNHRTKFDVYLLDKNSDQFLEIRANFFCWNLSKTTTTLTRKKIDFYWMYFSYFSHCSAYNIHNQFILFDFLYLFEYKFIGPNSTHAHAYTHTRKIL